MAVVVSVYMRVSIAALTGFELSLALNTIPLVKGEDLFAAHKYIFYYLLQDIAILTMQNTEMRNGKS
jgi:hypothetical protein